MMEESTSLKPRTMAKGVDMYRLQTEPQLCLEIVRLPPWTYVSWVGLLVFATFIPAYEWTFISDASCWSARFGHILVSIFFALLSFIIGLLLLVANSLIRVSISYMRLNFCTICFIVLTILATANFLTGVYLFSTTTCYFDHLLSAEKVEALPESTASTTPTNKVFEWLRLVTLKYDLKIVGMFHLLTCLAAFTTGMAFAIVKNNFKYVRQVDFD